MVANKHNILIIEDETDIRENLKEQLELTGKYNVYDSANGYEGIQYLDVFRIDLVICDINLPTLSQINLSGYDVLDIVRNNGDKVSDIPFLFLSGLTDDKSVKKGMKLAAENYIKKPYDLDELLEIIEMNIKRSEKRKELYFVDRHTYSTHINAISVYLDVLSATEDKNAVKEIIGEIQSLLKEMESDLK